jgi:glycosyltransferase involved in cell wall biosynthesis
MTKKKILFLHPNYYSGGSQVMIDIFNHLNKINAYSCFLMFIGKSNCVEKTMPLNENIIYFKYNYSNPIFVIKIIKFIIKNNIDIIYTHSPATHLVMSFINLFLRKKLILHVHGNFDNNPLKICCRMFFFNLGVTKIIAVSNDLKKSLIETYRLKSSKIIVSYNGVKDLSINKIDDCFKNNLINKYNLKDKFVIIFVGRLVKIKNLDLLINIASKTEEDITFLIVGDGPLKNDLEMKIKRRNLHKKVFLLGFIDNTRINTVLSISDLFILPSFHEGISISALEAISMDKPVMLSNVGGNPEILEKNTDLLFNISDETEIVKKINNLRNPNYYNKKRTLLRDTFEEKFSIDTNVQLIEQILKNLN